jgi:GDP-4-dehydro-6-deoxy-D-mannose reductase
LSLKIFITGATGFVGRHLINLLSSPEYAIFGTSFPEKPGPDEKKKNIVYLDIRSEKGITEAIKKAQPDWIFHLAALSNVRLSWEKRKETLETNLMATFYLFEAARKVALQARILFVSSSDVYGALSPPKKPFKEDDPFHVTSPYAFTKMSGEILSEFYVQIEKLDIIVARSFPHTGPGQSPEYVCSDWACQIAQIEKGMTDQVIRVGNIELQREFLDVRDVVKAYVLLMKKGRRGEAYNVCSGKALSLKEILGILLSYSSKKIEVNVDPQKQRKVDIPYLLGDNNKIKRETSWEPEIPLEKTLRDLLESWRQRV